jgi:hypothetical protein
MNKFVLALIGSLSLVALSGGSAAAQSAPDVYPQPPAQAPPASLDVEVPAAGQWVWVDGQGYVWVPEGTTSYALDDTPYVYVYTPSYGWSWCISPWGFGPYSYGAWVHRPWYADHGWRGGALPRYGGRGFRTRGGYGARGGHAVGGTRGAAHYRGVRSAPHYGGARVAPHRGGGGGGGRAGGFRGGGARVGHAGGGHFGGGRSGGGRGGGGRGGGGHGGGGRGHR